MIIIDQNNDMLLTFNRIIILLESINTKTFWDKYDITIQFFLGIFSSLLALYFGYLLSTFQEKKRFKRDCYFSFLAAINYYLFGLADLLMNIINIDKLGKILIQESIYKSFSFLPCNDFNLIALKIRTLRVYLENNIKENTVGYSSKKAYLLKIQELSDIVMEFNLFINLTSEMQKNSINYYFFMSSKIKNYYDSIIAEVQGATQNNMQGFDIFEFKFTIEKFSKLINKELDKI